MNSLISCLHVFHLFIITQQGNLHFAQIIFVKSHKYLFMVNNMLMKLYQYILFYEICEKITFLFILKYWEVSVSFQEDFNFFFKFELKFLTSHFLANFSYHVLFFRNNNVWIRTAKKQGLCGFQIFEKNLKNIAIKLNFDQYILLLFCIFNYFLIIH